MPDILIEALALPGLWILIGAALVSGIVRGFSGFGTAMIFLPFAALVVEPIWAILALIAMDMFGPLPLLRRAVGEAQWPDLSLLLGSACLSLPLGVWLITSISPETYRYGVSLLALGLIICLISGLRFTGRPNRAMVGGTGALAGVSGGLAGVPGPPVILLYMASSIPVAQVRANTFCFLFFFEFALLAVMSFTASFALLPLIIGLVLAIPNALGNMIGQAIFDPGRADLYRRVAYAIVALAAITGLPIWDR